MLAVSTNFVYFIFAAIAILVISSIILIIISLKSLTNYLQKRSFSINHLYKSDDGWVETMCSNCFHTYIFWEADENICTHCGVHYHNKQQSL